MLDLEPIKKRLEEMSAARCWNVEDRWRQLPEDIKRLVAEVKELRVERDRWHNAATVLSVEAIAAAAEIERLQEFEEVVPRMPAVSKSVQREFERWNMWENRGDVGPFKEDR